MYYEKASRMPGKTGENLLTLIERRLDNVVYRLGFAMTRREARQLVTHGHFTVNGQRVRHSLLPGEGGRRHRGPGEEPFLCQVQAPAGRGRHPGQCAQVAGPRDKNTLQGKVVAMPARDDIDFPVEEHLIVELYSK